MIDREAEIYTSVRNAVKDEYPDVTFSSQYKQRPSAFPFVYLEEISNVAMRATQDSGSLENHALVTYTAEVYTNSKDKKTAARAIASAVDGEMQRLGFTRILMEPFPNESDATIYRMIMRYRAVIGTDSHVYTG